MSAPPAWALEKARECLHPWSEWPQEELLIERIALALAAERERALREVWTLWRAVQSVLVDEHRALLADAKEDGSKPGFGG